MPVQAFGDNRVYEWQPCALVLPRFGLKLSRHGTSTSLLWPGRYLVRRSRTLGRWIYRALPRD